MLNINKTLAEKDLNISLEGRLDTMTAPDLEAQLTASLGGVENLVLILPSSSISHLQDFVFFCQHRRL